MSRRAMPLPPPAADPLFDRVASILEAARGRAIRAIHNEMVLAYWHIGREIVQHLQGGERRAEYGQAALDGLSASLTARFGRGFSVTNLRYFRLFYVAFADRAPAFRQSIDEFARQGETIPLPPSTDQDARLPSSPPIPARSGFSAALSWGHYRVLSSVEHPLARQFYEVEAERAGWSLAELERQIHSHLYHRLVKSRDPAGALELATQGQVIERPTDALRDPYVLDFLDLPDGPRLRESTLEAAIIDKLQHFLLELGKGFAFVARQKRLQYEGVHLYVDLVFYNCILKCYLLVDLKVGQLSHQDVGQMDSYVRLFDDQHTTEGDNPTIGLILCADHNEAVARYSVLNDREQIFAARYLPWLPTVEELQAEVQRERLLLEVQRPGRGRKRGA